MCKIYTFFDIFCYNFHFVPVIENHPHHCSRGCTVSAIIGLFPLTHVTLTDPVPRDGRILGLRAHHMNRKHLVGIFGYRIALALLTRSIFQPDEFFQSLEVAHNVVFGYGKLTWEWQPDVAIRSIIYPMLYVPVYWILRVTGLDTTGLLVCELQIARKTQRHI